MYNIYIFIYIYLSIYYSNLQYIFTFVGTYFEQGVGVSTSLNFTIVDVYIHTWWRKGDFEFGWICQHMTHQMLWKALLVCHPEKLLQVATYVAIYSKRTLWKKSVLAACIATKNVWVTAPIWPTFRSVSYSICIVYNIWMYFCIGIYV